MKDKKVRTGRVGILSIANRRVSVDMEVTGMLYGKILRSPLPYGEVSKIAVCAAEKMPGVVAVLTRDDFGDIDPFFDPPSRIGPF